MSDLGILSGEWAFRARELHGGADGSTLRKLFRAGTLSDTALLAREAVQNSFDAKQAPEPGSAEPPNPRVVFRFVEFFGAEKEEAVRALDLAGLRDRRVSYSPGPDPLQPGNVLESLDNPEVPLTLLYVEDYGTHGLTGGLELGMNSHLYLAMYYIGASGKGEEAGGSYGFGKAALQRASRLHTVIAHTAFARVGADPVQQRLVGFTWWPDFQVGNTFNSGLASLRIRGEDRAERSLDSPFEDEEAERIAVSLGFAARDPGEPSERGTSFLLIDPAIEPQSLVSEVERWWWPALEEHLLDVEVVLPSGERVHPKPASNAELAPYIRAYRLATGLDQVTDPTRERIASDEWRNRSGRGGKDLGKCVLVLPTFDDDSRPDDDEQCPKVALMRNSRMVVQYAKYSRSRVPVRGVFVASDEISPMLRDAEPSAHDAWTTNPSNDIPAAATLAARTVQHKVRDSVSRFIAESKPQVPRNDRSLALLSKLMHGFFGDKLGGGAAPGPSGEPIELHFPQGRPGPTVSDNGCVKVTTLIAIRAAEDAPGEACRVRVSCSLFVHEDDGQGLGKVELELHPSASDTEFVRDSDGSWVGFITKRSWVQFSIESAPYPDMWTTSLQPVVQRVDEWVE